MNIFGENYLISKKMNFQNQTQSIPSLDYSMQDTSDNTLPTRKYHAFLLRVWRDNELSPWRIQIEDPYTNEVIGFSSLAKLKLFLDEQFSTQGGDDTII